MTTFYIVTPSYNQGVFLEQTLRCLFEQKDVKVASIVQDGGSADNSVQILKKYGKKIRWVSQKDKGQSDALNQGLKKALALSQNLETDIFAYINSDDYYLPDVFSQVAAKFETHPEKMWLVGECQIVNENGQPIQKLVQIYKAFWRQFLSWSLLLTLNPIPQPAVFMRLSAVKKVGFFETTLRYTMDYQYWLRFWQAFGPPIVISETLAAFRIHSLSKGGSQFQAQFDEELAVAKTFTTQPILLWLHQLHNAMIKGVYSLLK